MGWNERVRGITAVVTGASSGIGLEFCRRLVAESCARLVMVSNQEAELARYSDELRNSGSVEVYTLCLDLTDAACAGKLCEFLDEKGLQVDLLINNAGIFSFCPVLDTPERKIDCFIDLHMRAVTALSIAIGKRMRERGSGRILNMSSLSCWTPMPGIAMYAATKAYIRVFSRALHYELRDSGVTVTVACPGGIATDLFGLPTNLMKLAVGIKAVQTPQVFVKKALKAVMKGKMQYINGFINRLAIVGTGLAPTPVRMMIKHKMLDKGIKRLG